MNPFLPPLRLQKTAQYLTHTSCPNKPEQSSEQVLITTDNPLSIEENADLFIWPSPTYFYFYIPFFYSTRLFPLYRPTLDFGIEHASPSSTVPTLPVPSPCLQMPASKFRWPLAKSNYPFTGASTTFGKSFIAFSTFSPLYPWVSSSCL